jgi:hypothetical protein
VRTISWTSRPFSVRLIRTERRSVPIGGISEDDFGRLNQSLTRLERFWTDQIRYRL